MAANLIYDDLLRVLEPADLAGATGCPNPSGEDEDVKHDQEYNRLTMRQSHHASGRVSRSEVDDNPFERPASAGRDGRKPRTGAECNPVSYPVADASAGLLDWS